MLYNSKMVLLEVLNSRVLLYSRGTFQIRWNHFQTRSVQTEILFSRRSLVLMTVFLFKIRLILGARIFFKKKIIYCYIFLETKLVRVSG